MIARDLAVRQRATSRLPTTHPRSVSAALNPELTVDDVIIPPPPDDAVVDPRTWFATPGELEIEIGCGKGGFLLRRAQQYPDRRLLGLEWANKFFRFAADRMARRGLDQVRLMRADARVFVERQLAAECVSAFHLYHPDPWPKKRHHKRRLIQGPFVDAAVRALRVGGRWAIQTDHQEYFEQIRSVVLAHPRLVQVPFTDPGFGVGETADTNFEIKYRREGRTFLRLAVVKV